MIDLVTKKGERIVLSSVSELAQQTQDFVVIQFQDYTDNDLEWVKSHFQLDLSIMGHFEDIEISSHFQEKGQQSSFHFSVPYYKANNVFVEESIFVILISDRLFLFTSASLDKYFTDIYTHKFDAFKELSPNAEELFKFQIELLSDYFADLTENIAKRIKRLATRVLVRKEFQEDDLDIITQLNFNNILIKESINEFVRILILHRKSSKNSSKSVKDKIDEEMSDLSVVSDYIQFNFDRLDDLKENISNKIELEQNKIFKLLTMVTFCISLPTLIAGIYGMNFQHMPELNTKYGYFFALGAMLVSVVIPLAYFRKKKWL